MIKLERSGPEWGDSTAPYSVYMSEPYTVRTFIDDILKNPREWGYIGITEKDLTPALFCDLNCQYSHGKLISEPLPEEYLKKRVISATADGGWTRMDYALEVEE